MAHEDVKKIALVTKTGLYDWTTCPLVSKMPLVLLPEQCPWSSRNWEANS
jgi:hypothetical protein